MQTMEIGARVISELERAAPGDVVFDEPMSRHTSYGVGGPADVFLAPTGPDAFKDACAVLVGEDIPLTILGRGTNVLVRSGGIEGAVVVTERAFPGIERTGARVRVGSGVALPRLLSYCADEGLTGLEPLAGIPGSVGGAVVMNAGSFGVWFGDSMAEVRLHQPGKSSVALASSDLDRGYRRARLPEGFLVECAALDLERDDEDAVRERTKETLRKKWNTQPADMRSAGCVFKNPEGDAAGRLIDAAGLKGRRIGGAVVSDLHANFLLNDRGASPEELEDLIALVRATVREETGVELDLEIQIIGRAGAMQ